MARNNKAENKDKLLPCVKCRIQSSSETEPETVYAYAVTARDLVISDVLAYLGAYVMKVGVITTDQITASEVGIAVEVKGHSYLILMEMETVSETDVTDLVAYWNKTEDLKSKIEFQSAHILLGVSF